MIIDSLEQFAAHMQDHWIGKKVSVTKTNPMPPIELQVNKVRTMPWQKMVKPIRVKHPQSSSFLVVAGKNVVNTAADHSAPLRTLVINVDKGTIFDVRDNRLVLLSDEEVVQFMLKEEWM